MYRLPQSYFQSLVQWKKKTFCIKQWFYKIKISQESLFKQKLGSPATSVQCLNTQLISRTFMDLFAFSNTISMQGFIHLLDKYLLCSYSEPGTRASAVNSIGMVPALVELILQQGRQTLSKNDKNTCLQMWQML